MGLVDVSEAEVWKQKNKTTVKIGGIMMRNMNATSMAILFPSKYATFFCDTNSSNGS